METGKRISDELSSAIEKLRDAGVLTPQLDAQLLMARALDVSRLDVIAHPEQTLSQQQHLFFAEMLGRRVDRYPLAYILGEKEFFGLSFDVTPAVLIPRPETEVLVEEVLKLARGDARIADVGTGSGAIAVALAVNLPRAQVWATDTSEEALKVARANAEKHGVADQIRFIRGDLVEPLIDMGLEFEVVASNPPYVRSEDAESLDPEVRHEPAEALYGGPTGLEVYRRLFEQAGEVSRMVIVELGMGQAASVAEIAGEAGFSSVSVVRDLAGIERVATAQR